jgi:hypothetical protein
MTVGEVWQEHHRLEGQVVRVEGIITRCYDLSCPLKESVEDGAKWLGIGTSDTFDAEVQSYLGRRIVVEGRLRGECLHTYADPKEQTHRADGEFVGVICTDRSSMLLNPKLVGVAS